MGATNNQSANDNRTRIIFNIKNVLIDTILRFISRENRLLANNVFFSTFASLFAGLFLSKECFLEKK